MVQRYVPAGESFPVADAAARWAFTDTDMTALNAAYDVLTRRGNETSHDGTWDPVLDRAHHGIGLILGLVVADSRRNKPEQGGGNAGDLKGEPG